MTRSKLPRLISAELRKSFFESFIPSFGERQFQGVKVIILPDSQSGLPLHRQLLSLKISFHLLKKRKEKVPRDEVIKREISKK
jgi:hypothetical protein